MSNSLAIAAVALGASIIDGLQQFGPGYAAWVAELGETRNRILASDLGKDRKLDLLHSLASREALEAALIPVGSPPFRQAVNILMQVVGWKPKAERDD